MERIINVLGKNYRLSSNIEPTAEQMNNVIKRIEAAGGDLKKLQTTCFSLMEPLIMVKYRVQYTALKSGIPPDLGDVGWLCVNGIDTEAKLRVFLKIDVPPCTPSWVCEQPLNGYEKDGCGNRRVNTICNPTGGCIPNWICEQPLNGYEKDGCGNRRINTICNPTGGCIPNWQCEQPLNGYESDGCGNRRVNPDCKPGVGAVPIIGIGLIGAGLLGAVVIASRKKRRGKSRV